MTTPDRGEGARIRERARAFIGKCLPWSIKPIPQGLEGPVPRGAGDERFESREAGRTGTSPITAPAAVFAAAPTSASAAAPTANLDELWKYLPQGSVYLWAAMVDGAAATDAIAGWIILMAQISCYILILANSPKRTLDDLHDDLIVHVPIYKTQTIEDISFEVFSAYTSDGATFIKTRHSVEPISYALSPISAAVYLVVTFAVGDLRTALALLQTRTLYNMILGVAILASFVLLVLASLSILFFLANDNASFIVGAAAVLFISDLDEKLWTALQMVCKRSRIFWCIEAFAVSLVLAIAGIAWFGITAAISSEGIDMLKGILISSSVLFDTGFVLMIGLIGATVGAWEIALFLQHVAERCTGTNNVRPRNLGNFLFLNVLVMGHQMCSLFSAMLSWGTFFSLGLGVLPLVLSAAAGIAMYFPCCTNVLSRGRLKMLLGVGIGYVISVGHRVLSLIMYFLGLQGQWSVEYWGAVAFTAALSLFLAVSLVKAIGQSFESYPADTSVLTWRLKCCRRDSADNPGHGDDPTVFGAVIVVWGLYLCAAFFLVLAITVHLQYVML